MTDRPQYQASSPPPTFQHHGQTAQAPAPFYVGGTEVPSHAGGGQAPSAQQYPPTNQTSQAPPGNKQPAPISTSPPPPQNYTPYTQNVAVPYSQPSGQQRPQSTYGAQELATSVYDSPIAPNNPNSAVTFSSSVYSQDDANNEHNASAPPAQYGQQGPYQSYRPPEQVPPPVPSGQPPQPPQDGVATAPLHPSGPAYDSRQRLPSQNPGAPEPQYKPYVPPGAAEGPSAPAPGDYYRQPGVY